MEVVVGLWGEQVLEFFWNWGFCGEDFRGAGDGDVDFVGVEVEAFGFGGLLKVAVEGEVSVVSVSNNGVAVEGGLDAELVCAAGFGGEFEEGKGEGVAGGLEACEGGAGREATPAFGYTELVVFFAAFEAVFPVTSFGGGDASYDGEVLFVDLFVAEEFVEGIGNFGIEGGDNDSGGRGVETIVEVQFATFPCVGLCFLVIVGGEEGVGINAGLVWMRQDAGGFFNGKDTGGVLCQDSGIRMKRKHFVKSRKGVDWKRGEGELERFSPFIGLTWFTGLYR